MKLCPSLFILGPFLLVPLLLAAETGIEFSGVLTADGKTRVALTDTAKSTTTWVEPGAEFNGYKVARYDAKEEAVFLEKGGHETRIGLVAAKTADARPASLDDSPSTQAAIAAIRTNLRALVSAARQYQLEHGVASAGYLDLVGPGKIIPLLKPVAGENYTTLNFGPNVTAVSVTTASGATVTYELPTLTLTSPPTGTGAPAAPGRTTPPPAIARPVTAPATAEPLLSTGRQPASPSYTIQGGDTWQSIAQATGVAVAQLKQLNPAILEGSPLPAGQTIRIR